MYCPHGTGVFRAPVRFADFNHRLRYPVVVKFGFFDRNGNAFDLKRRKCGRAEGSGASQ